MSFRGDKDSTSVLIKIIRLGYQQKLRQTKNMAIADVRVESNEVTFYST